MNRREFIGGAAAIGAMTTLGDAARTALGDAAMTTLGDAARTAPVLRFGALSDIHILYPGTEKTFEHALRWFDRAKADAVMICGDLADWGLTSQLKNVADAWFRVFPENRRSDGEPIEKLFIYGDHDTGLNPETLENLVKSEEKRNTESIPLNDRAKIWEDCFHEKWEPIQLKTVKGYKFVLYHFNMSKPGLTREEWLKDFGKNWGYGQTPWGLKEFLAAHKEELAGPKPFFYAQHRVFKNTVGGPFMWGQDSGVSTQVLSDYPNCIAFCGHQHAPSTDERMIWQGAFTALEVPSLSYFGMFGGYENSFSLADRDFSKKNADKFWPRKQMPKLDVGGETKPVARHGFLVNVYPDAVTVERECFISDQKTAPDWVIPLPSPGDKPFDHAFRAAHDPAPKFPAGAKASVKRAMGKDRYGTDTDQLTVTFPTANSTADTPRAYDYEVQPIVHKNTITKYATAKRVYSPGIIHPESKDKMATCVFAVTDIPNEIDSVDFVVTPLNAFGKRGDPLKVTFKERLFNL